MLLGKEIDFGNISVPLWLDVLQAQSQEHMCSLPRIPQIKLLGIQRRGLTPRPRAEAAGNWTRFIRGGVRARPNLTTILDLVQLNRFGRSIRTSPSHFEPLAEELPVEQAAAAAINGIVSAYAASSATSLKEMRNVAEALGGGSQITDKTEPRRRVADAVAGRIEGGS